MKSLAALLVCLLSFPIARLGAEEAAPPLAAYVAKADDSYGWTRRRQGKLAGNEYVELTLTSQTWHGIVWKHQLFILKPERLRDTKAGLLVIAGGSWRDELAAPLADSQDQLPKEAVVFATLAAQIGAPVAVLMHVPQQPIFGGMKEDEIISFTFEEFIKTNDDSWPLLLPMVKSAVRGMDAVQALAKEDWSLDLERFTVTGASKRGWTTWLTAAVDPRVQALAPMVIDVLNMAPQMQHQLATWGKFSEQIEDYTRRGIQQHMATAGGSKLRDIVDPYSYRTQLTQPKLILLGTNDRYWPLDALNLYWDDLPGEKRVLYIPNNGHGLRDLPRIVGTITALHRQAAGELTLPQLTWRLDADGADGLNLRVQSDVRPKTVSVWIATSPTRDFRDARWESQPLAEADGAYSHQLASPGAGFAAMFGEAVYDTDGIPYFLSTNVRILPALSPAKAGE